MGYCHVDDPAGETRWTQTVDHLGQRNKPPIECRMVRAYAVSSPLARESRILDWRVMLCNSAETEERVFTSRRSFCLDVSDETRRRTEGNVE